MSFAILISEKGGAERRELFDKGEISLGRVQGNDLMLPKGNVSKRHAKLSFREGRFIIHDLNSTNGTYVNGRKILQATVVREGDKIYVGDYVLRFEAGPGVVLAPESLATAPGPREATPAELGSPSSAPREPISHYPLENDPDEGNQSPRLVIPGPPKMPSGFVPRSGGTQAINVLSQPSQGPATDSGNPAIHAMAHQVVSSLGAPAAAPRPGPPVVTQPPGPPSIKPVSLPPSPARESSASLAAHRLAFLALMDRLSEAIDLEPLRGGGPIEATLSQKIERATREQITHLKQGGEIPEKVDLAALARDAQRELLALGPLGALIDDDDVASIHVSRHDSVLAQRSAGVVAAEPAFSSDDALQRALARLCYQANQPLRAGEAVIERNLPWGSLLAVSGALSAHGHSLTLRKRRRSEVSPEDPVRSGAASRGLWTFLQQALAARLNILVAAPAGPGFSSFVGALVGALPTDERVAVLQAPELPFQTPAQASLFWLDTGHSDPLLRAVLRSSAERVVLGAFSGGLAAALLDGSAGRALPLLAALPAPGLRQGLGRLIPEMCAARPGLAPDVARDWLLSSFDLLLEIGRLRDGRSRVLRLAEFSGTEQASTATRDIFSLVPDRASGESSLFPTGVVPRCLDELRLRGFSIEPSTFERISSR